MSKKLNAAEQNYPTNAREFLALLQALRHWRHYVLGPHVIAFTDNVALRDYKTAPNLSPRMVRWLADIEQYNLQIRHIPVATNTAADALSRLACCPLVASTDADSWLEDYREDHAFASQFGLSVALLSPDRLHRGRFLGSRSDLRSPPPSAGGFALLP